MEACLNSEAADGRNEIPKTELGGQPEKRENVE